MMRSYILLTAVLILGMVSFADATVIDVVWTGSSAAAEGRDGLTPQTALAASDYAYRDPVVGAGHARVAGSGQRQRSGPGGSLLQEFASAGERGHSRLSSINFVKIERYDVLSTHTV